MVEQVLPPVTFDAHGRDANAVLTMGPETATAKTDGSLQTNIPDGKSPGRWIHWNRQYYVVPLEVPPYLAMTDVRPNDIIERIKRRSLGKLRTLRIRFLLVRFLQRCWLGYVMKNSTINAIKRYPNPSLLPCYSLSPHVFPQWTNGRPSRYLSHIHLSSYTTPPSLLHI